MRQKPNPILAQVAHPDVKSKMWKYSKQLRSRFNVRLEDDVPTDVFQAWKVLKLIMFEAKKQSAHNPEKKNNVWLKDDSLILNGHTYTVDNLHQLPEDLQPANIFTRTKGDKAAFFPKYSPLSNHHPAKFKVEGKTFLSSKQFFRLAKALAFGDKQQENLIMEATDPVEQKRLGSNIKGFKAGHWRNKMEEAMEKVIRAKFTQNQDLKVTPVIKNW